MQAPRRPPPAGDGLPPVEQVRPGLWSLPVPIPDSPLRHVFAYAFEVPGGVVLVDPGWNAPEALQALEEGLRTAGARLADVRGVLVTHIHPDHYGLAGKVRELSGAWVALHPADAANVPDRHQDVDDLLARIVRWLAATGAPADDLDQLRDATMQLRRFVVVARPDVLLADGDRAEVPGWDLRALHTPGHTPGHLCFVEARAGVVLTGDHVLATISPNVSSHPQSGPDPLGDYLASLARLRAHGGLDALPGHQWRFGGLGERIGELLAHHQVRLADAEALVAGGAETAYQVAAGLRWSRPFAELRGFGRRAALFETLAHLLHLERRGRLVRTGEDPLRWRRGSAAGRQG
ncbi:MAG TPA: MBL fold metallo-hydrolase [Actinomycetes bacterium]|nr:MBL fold metallo-hydrolase [Actinomycetes bacterium]